MNRRQILSHATCLIPGASFLQGPTKAAASFPAGGLGVSCFGEEDAILASRNTEEVVMELLHICLARIGWQGAVSDWQSRLDQSLDRVQSRLVSETNPPPLLITAFQMDCLTDLCHAATVGDEAETLSRAILLCDAILPFHHWCENHRMWESNKQALFAQHHPEIHALLSAALQRPCYAPVMQRSEDSYMGGISAKVQKPKTVASLPWSDHNHCFNFQQS